MPEKSFTAFQPYCNTPETAHLRVSCFSPYYSWFMVLRYGSEWGCLGFRYYLFHSTRPAKGRLSRRVRVYKGENHPLTFDESHLSVAFNARPLPPPTLRLTTARFWKKGDVQQASLEKLIISRKLKSSWTNVCFCSSTEPTFPHFFTNLLLLSVSTHTSRSGGENFQRKFTNEGDSPAKVCEEENRSAMRISAFWDAFLRNAVRFSRNLGEQDIQENKTRNAAFPLNLALWNSIA